MKRPPPAVVCVIKLIMGPINIFINVLATVSFVLSQYTRLTEIQADGLTDRQNFDRQYLACISRLLLHFRLQLALALLHNSVEQHLSAKVAMTRRHVTSRHVINANS